MVTLGHTITEELKESVYANQALNSQIAMCFDVIPIRTLAGARSDRLDLSNRRFDRSDLERCARATGKNLKRQIEYFLEKGTQAKPMLIAQGNDYDSYMKWVEYIQDEMPKEYVKHIGGIAMGAAALGKGSLEDIKRAFYFTQLPIELENKNLHLLGVGSVYRMLPQLIFGQSGLYKDVHMSYDSTTHTSGVVQGRYYMDDFAFCFTRAYDDSYRIVMEDMKQNFPCIHYSVDDLYNVLNCSSKTYQSRYGSIDPSLQLYVAYVASSIKNFIDQVDRVSRSKAEVMKFAKGLDKNAFDALYSVQTPKDFEHWVKHVGPYMSSEPVREYVQPNSLESLFV